MRKFAGFFAGVLTGGTLGFLLMILWKQFLPVSPGMAFYVIVGLAVAFAVIGVLNPKRFSWVINLIPFP